MQDLIHLLYRDIDETPDEPRLVGVLADVYDDLGDAGRADFLRWTVARGHVPFCFRRAEGKVSPDSQHWTDGWFWWACPPEGGRGEWGHPPSCRLPSPVWRLLRHTFSYSPAFVKQYPSRRDAYEALYELWPLISSAAGRPTS